MPFDGIRTKLSLIKMNDFCLLKLVYANFSVWVFKYMLSLKSLVLDLLHTKFFSLFFVMEPQNFMYRVRVCLYTPYFCLVENLSL